MWCCHTPVHSNCIATAKKFSVMLLRFKLLILQLNCTCDILRFSDAFVHQTNSDSVCTVELTLPFVDVLLFRLYVMACYHRN